MRTGLVVGRARRTTDLSVYGVVDSERMVDRRTDVTRALFRTSQTLVDTFER